MVKKCARHNIGLRRIATEDGGFLLQVLLTIVVISAGILFQLNVIQWGMIALLSSVFLITGFYRNAAHLVAIYDDNMSWGQAKRLRAMSNIIVTVTAGFTFFSFLIIFMPKINQLL